MILRLIEKENEEKGYRREEGRTEVKGKDEVESVKETNDRHHEREIE